MKLPSDTDEIIAAAPVNSCCVTGHRPQNFPPEYRREGPHSHYVANLNALVERVAKAGCKRFISGGAIGVDQDFAQRVIELKFTGYFGIELELALPCLNQDLKWTEQDKLRYRRICSGADKITMISEHYTAYCMQKRNEYMVDNSDLVLAFWNGIEKGGTYNTIRYAERKGKRLIIVRFD